MIRLNLLPVRGNRKRDAVLRHLVVFGIGLVVVIGLSLLRVNGKRSEVASWSAKNTTLQNDIDDLRRIVGEVDIFLERKEELERKLEVISQLRASKTGPVHMLDEIATRIPTKLWLDSLAEQNGRLTLTGSSINNEVIATFMSRLEESAYFAEVFLVSIQASEYEEIRLKDFTITARVLRPSGDAVAEGGAR